jgi:hypothetical protein
MIIFFHIPYIWIILFVNTHILGKSCVYPKHKEITQSTKWESYLITDP